MKTLPLSDGLSLRYHHFAHHPPFCPNSTTPTSSLLPLSTVKPLSFFETSRFPYHLPHPTPPPQLCLLLPTNCFPLHISFPTFPNHFRHLYQKPPSSTTSFPPSSLSGSSTLFFSSPSPSFSSSSFSSSDPREEKWAKNYGAKTGKIRRSGANLDSLPAPTVAEFFCIGNNSRRVPKCRHQQSLNSFVTAPTVAEFLCIGTNSRRIPDYRKTLNF